MRLQTRGSNHAYQNSNCCSVLNTKVQKVQLYLNPHICIISNDWCTGVCINIIFQCKMFMASAQILKIDFNTNAIMIDHSRVHFCIFKWNRWRGDIGSFDNIISINCSTVYLHVVPKQCDFNRFSKPKYIHNCNSLFVFSVLSLSWF